MFIPPGWTPADVEHELIDSPTRAWVPFPGLEVIDRPDWMQLTCIHFPTGGLNEISRARLTDADADRVIDETVTHYASRGLTFRWSVVPGTTPADLGERLARRGFRSHEVVAMARSTQASDELPAGITVTEVDLSTVDVFTRVMAEGWGAPIGAMGDYNRACLADPSRKTRLFVASVDGQPAGTGGAVFFERSVYMLGGVVLPAFRRRGVYAALERARLSAARAAGIALATTLAMATTSAPLLLRRGWEAWFRFESWSPAGLPSP